MNNDELVKKFEKEFKDMRKRLKFKTNLDELDDILYLRDRILKIGYIPRNLSRMICSVMVDRLKGEGNYLHGLIIPNPQSMPSLTEVKLFDEKEKEEFKRLMSKIMFLSSISALNELKKDRLGDGKLIDNAMKFWNEICKPKMIEVLKKVSVEWNKEDKKSFTR